MIKAILFDVDGVVLLPRDKYFSQRLKDDGYEVDVEKVGQFFKNQYKQVVIGKADLKEELSKVIVDWGWKGTVEELLEYWFSYENKANEGVIELAQELRNSGIKCYLASDHSKYREDDLLSNPIISGYFDGAFFSASLGHTKEEKEFFEIMLNQLDLKEDEVVFVDDDEKNVEVAKEVLDNAILFTSVERLKGELSV